MKLKQTQHYQLIKWDPSDRVLRQNFNDNNDKIDAALHKMEEKANFVKLKTVTTTEKIVDGQNFTIDVSDINWSAWQYIYVDFMLKGNGYMLLYPNERPDDAVTHGAFSGSYKSLVGEISTGQFWRGEFHVYGRGQQPLTTVMPQRLLYGGSAYWTYDTLKTLHLKPGYTTFYMDPGSTITFYGVR